MVASEADPVTPAAGGADTGDGSEPDFRFIMANERTFLAWQRTALALLAVAVAVVQFVPHALVLGGQHMVAGLLAVLAILSAVNGIRRWEQVDAAMRKGAPLPNQHIPAWLGIGLVLVAVVAIVLVLGRAVPS